MADDTKHTEVVQIRLTEREMIDSARMAAEDDRKHADFIRYVLRKYMYGRMSQSKQACEPSCGDKRNCRGDA